jgi:hypothetical protein
MSAVAFSAEAVVRTTAVAAALLNRLRPKVEVEVGPGEAPLLVPLLTGHAGLAEAISTAKLTVLIGTEIKPLPKKWSNRPLLSPTSSPTCVPLVLPTLSTTTTWLVIPCLRSGLLRAAPTLGMKLTLRMLAGLVPAAGLLLEVTLNLERPTMGLMTPRT